ncbi:helix-turn-helix domain-containing protein [Streptomyces sp. NPDC055140]
MHTAGGLDPDLANGCGRSYGFVHRVFTEAGTAMRSRGGSNGRSRSVCAREGTRRHRGLGLVRICLQFVSRPSTQEATHARCPGS